MHYKLSEEIIKRSISGTWDEAKLEWYFDSAYKSPTPQTCLCGHNPIINICTIINKKNHTQVDVGNCCVTKFMGIKDGKKVFDSITRLNKDIKKSLSPEVIEFLKGKKVIDDFEFNFYLDTLRKKKLTQKQASIRERINQKFLDFVSPQRISINEKISKAIVWASHNPDFDASFFHSLKSSMDKYNRLTPKQEAALEKVMERWKIV
ncbi:hypothetical protein KIH41_17155 [Litoribacter ruber]|uniref:hypothetical protein n=1 Tax=Litoribacter ruber TaxID=702568 RepID=UPI001BD9B240|nr:hypothetical protein [Litoribacter ruber]MBT0813019.1 hypothetical protein [Litoribacter ruber]